MTWSAWRVDHRVNWYRHWSTLTLLVQSTRQLFLMRAAALMPASHRNAHSNQLDMI